MKHRKLQGVLRNLDRLPTNFACVVLHDRSGACFRHKTPRRGGDRAPTTSTRAAIQEEIPLAERVHYDGVMPVELAGGYCCGYAVGRHAVGTL
jgi:hypothetical protein